ncbi:hypothetical protein SLEP1_g6460 [Rubroshorea leprosula]|uniref:Helitron helicase-like domain-containing protein n=1 Tax=Rubroshorea leprosula TaxID=152421 RepID=A0AAV5I4G5_9ROSI|nr:hypothetical protein SLEP1_g6460 [Rubroshorea leprosula]
MRVSTTTNKERGKIPVNPLEVKTLGTLTENLLRVASTHEISPGNEMVQVYEYSKIIPRANLLSEFEDYLLRSTRENVMKGIKQDGRQMEIGESSNSATRISEKIVRTIEESQENIFTSAQSQEIRRTGIRRQNGANPFDVPQRSTRKRQREASNNDNEVHNRLNVANTSTDDDPLNKEIIEDLIKMFDECNKLVQVFWRARDTLVENGIPEFQLKLLSGGGPGDHQYSAPEMAETVGLIIGAEEEILQGRDVIIQHRNGTVKRINSSFPYYMALQYSILFPYGEEGYRNNLYEVDENGNQTNDRISICDYYRYYFQFRVNEWNTIMYGGRLSQQFVVYVYCCVEEQRLLYHRLNQSQLRIEFYNGVVDVVNKGDTDGKIVGKKIILP